MEDEKDASNLVRFPFSRSGLSKTHTPPRNLGLTKLSQQVNPQGKGAKGHWCKNCKGIWFSYFFEAECPVCGRRS